MIQLFQQVLLAKSLHSYHILMFHFSSPENTLLKDRAVGISRFRQLFALNDNYEFLVQVISRILYHSNFENHFYKDFHRAHNTLSLPLWHSITFDLFLQIQRIFQWLLKMQWATAFYANHLLDNPMDARCLLKYCLNQTMKDHSC